MKNKLFVFVSTIIVIIISLSACTLLDFRDDKETNPTEITTENTTVLETQPTQTEAIKTEKATTIPVTQPEGTGNYGVDISSMTLEEKVAQMILVSCHENVDIDDAIEKGVGGLCLYSFSFDDKTYDEVVEMTSHFQDIANIPLLISTDEEGGIVNRISTNENLRAVPFWSPSELFAEGGWELIESDTEEKADLLLSLGVNVNLAPVCDVPLSEDNYIYERTFSMDHQETADYVSLVVSTMDKMCLGSTLKHFPGHGGSVDTHENIGYDHREYSAFENGDFLPFISGIESGADSVLVSHNIVECMDNEMPASLSKPVHDILRNDLGFDGVIITDDLIMEAITQFTDGESAALYAVKAGNDLLCCENYDEAVFSIVNAVNNGEISEDQIDASVKRILKWKADLNLL